MQRGKEKENKKKKKLRRDDFLPSTHTETQHDESQTPPFGRELRFALRLQPAAAVGINVERFRGAPEVGGLFPVSLLLAVCFRFLGMVIIAAGVPRVRRIKVAQ